MGILLVEKADGTRLCTENRFRVNRDNANVGGAVHVRDMKHVCLSELRVMRYVSDVPEGNSSVRVPVPPPAVPSTLMGSSLRLPEYGRAVGWVGGKIKLYTVKQCACQKISTSEEVSKAQLFHNGKQLPRRQLNLNAYAPGIQKHMIIENTSRLNTCF